MIREIRKEIKSLWRLWQNRIRVSPKTEAEIVDAFHHLFYAAHLPENETWMKTQWLGVNLLKCPFDLWIYQEILHEVKPDLIIETGTAFGGSAYYMASLCDLMNHGRIITVDIMEREGRPVHPRIEYLTGSSVGPEIVARLEKEVASAKRVLVILDSDHSKDHVARELEIYPRWVTPGSYVIVEDSNVNGHPVFAKHGPGPMEAIEDFLTRTNVFAIDRSKERYHLTFNPKGYLKRIR